MKKGVREEGEELLRRSLIKDPRFTYKDIGAALGVTRQAVELHARNRGYRPAWRVRVRPTGPTTLPLDAGDRRHFQSLVDLGLTQEVARRLLGFTPVQVQRFRVEPRNRGMFRALEVGAAPKEAALQGGLTLNHVYRMRRRWERAGLLPPRKLRERVPASSSGGPAAGGVGERG